MLLQKISRKIQIRQGKSILPEASAAAIIEKERTVATKYVKNDYSEIALYIDESAKKLSFVQFDTEEKLIYDFRELKECLVLNNGAAAISAADFLTAAKPLSLSLSLRVTTSNIQHPAYEIPLITSSTDQASDEYREKMKFAQELYTAITNIINQN